MIYSSFVMTHKIRSLNIVVGICVPYHCLIDESAGAQHRICTLFIEHYFVEQASFFLATEKFGRSCAKLRKKFVQDL